MDNQTMNIIAVIVGPVIAVIITLAYQRQKEKQEIKHKVFLTLMGHRKSIPISFALVEALNTLDVIFHANDKVIRLWHEYYEFLCQTIPDSRALENQKHKYLELLSAIAEDLGYKNLQQTDIDKFYIPQGHVDQAEMQGKIQTEFLRVLQNTAAFEVKKKDDGSS
ncbi:MAG: hypothetical protein HZB62_14395 [Nitrospirae bacterium]|nr:hypothetical protein [Nitrospirota bacterium]